MFSSIERRYGAEKSAIIYMVAAFVTDHPMECWSTQTDFEAKNVRNRKESLVKRLLVDLLENLKNRCLSYHLVENVLYVFYYVLNKLM